ncbi:hypothetical protein N7468_004880 [Penicillium chermesinum]|uniref:Uncharacterized protein n=1 Tax=Penicillium chermesinum TaxID=63820 RepID=A0A9W9TT02_9EURO|nr:uncharacterized protein N7468_004880 [Penicillium chermesinum]KAJ5240261.1 hypothetical protein N7468_004880 [Penicillium chermesinum]
MKLIAVSLDSDLMRSFGPLESHMGQEEDPRNLGIPLVHPEKLEVCDSLNRPTEQAMVGALRRTTAAGELHAQALRAAYML